MPFLLFFLCHAFLSPDEASTYSYLLVLLIFSSLFSAHVSCFLLAMPAILIYFHHGLLFLT